MLGFRLDAYLRRRFGDDAARSLEARMAGLDAACEFGAAPIDKKYLKQECMEWLKQSSVWSKRKSEVNNAGDA